MQVVLDTNVVVSVFMFPGSVPGSLLEHWNTGDFAIVVSAALLSEYQRVLNYPHLRPRHRLSSADIEQVMDRFRTKGLLVSTEKPARVVPADPDDDVVIACAVAGDADYIVSGDRHLLEIGVHAGIRILLPAVFLVLLESGY